MLKIQDKKKVIYKFGLNLAFIWRKKAKDRDEVGISIIELRIICSILFENRVGVYDQ